MSDLIVELLARRPPAAGGAPDRLRMLLELLDRPDRAVPVVWVGGAHGKSSVIAMVSALFAAFDVTAGSATAPHLQDLRERVRIAGEAISASALREALVYLEPFVHEVDLRFGSPLTFDEVLHTLAATWFADAPVDVALFEGSPHDSARCDVAVRLGGEQAAVGAQAAGPEATQATTVTGGDGQARRSGDDFGVGAREIAVGGQRLKLHGATGTVSDVYLPLHGAHQADNAATALVVLEAFLGYTAKLDVDLIRRAYASVRLPGRLEVVRRTDASSVLLDGAHDPAAARALAAALADEFTLRNRVGVAGLASADVDVDATISTLAGSLDHVVVVQAPTPDAADPAAVVAAAQRAGLAVETAETVPAALELASGVATAEDAVVVFGGLQTVGAARGALGLRLADDLLEKQ